MPRFDVIGVALAAFWLMGSNAGDAQQTQTENQPKAARVDKHGDPLPPGAIARIGTTRYRHGGMELLGFSPDGKSLLYLGGGALHFMDVASGKETTVFRHSDVEQRDLRRFGGFANTSALSGDGAVLALHSYRDFNGSSTISIIETATGKERKKFSSTDLFKNGVQFFQSNIGLSDDGKLLLVSANNQRGGGPGKGATGPPLIWLDTTTGQRGPEATPQKDCRFGHAQFTHDGRQVVAIEHDDSNGKARLRFFDATRGAEVRVVDLPANSNLGRFKLRPDGKTLFGSSAGGPGGGPGGGPVRLYDFTQAKELKELRAFSDLSWNGALAMSPDGKHLFIANQGKIHHWGADDGKEIRKFDAPAVPKDDNRFVDPIFRVDAQPLTVSQDGKLLAYSGSQSVRVYDVESGSVKAGTNEGVSISVVRFTPDGAGLVVQNAQQQIELWNPQTIASVRKFTPFPDQGPRNRGGFEFFNMFVGHAEFSWDGQLLGVGMGENGVGVWDSKSGATVKWYGPDPDKPKDRDLGPDAIPYAFAFSPRDKTLATSTPGGSIKLWDTGTGQGLRSWTWHNSAPVGEGMGIGRQDAAMLSLAFSPDGKTLAGGGVLNLDLGMPQTTLILWEAATGKERLRLRSPIKGIGPNEMDLEMIFMMLDQMALSLAFSPDGKHLMIGTFNGFHVVDAMTGKDVVSYSGRLLLGRTATFSGDGKLLFVGRVDGSLRVIDVPSARVLADLPAHAEPILSLAISNDGKVLASGSNDSTVLLWDTAELAKAMTIQPAKVTSKDLEKLWNDLADSDAAKAYQAINALAAAPAEATAFLKTHLKAISPADPKVVEKFLDDLSSEKFALREIATVELEKLGELAKEALEKRKDAGPPLETLQRIEKLYAKLTGPVESPQLLQALRAIETLERIGTSEAREILVAISKGAPRHSVTVDAQKSVGRLDKLKKGQ